MHDYYIITFILKIMTLRSKFFLQKGWAKSFSYSTTILYLSYNIRTLYEDEP